MQLGDTHNHGPHKKYLKGELSSQGLTVNLTVNTTYKDEAGQRHKAQLDILMSALSKSKFNNRNSGRRGQFY